MKGKNDRRDYSVDNHPKIDILIIPGGEGTKKKTVVKGGEIYE